MALSNVSHDSATGAVLRAGRRVGLAALVLCFGCDGLQTAAANGDTRTITFHHQHTGEALTITYKRDGRYDDEALKKINWELRDWRRNEAVRMDPQVIDAVWELYRAVDGKDGVEIICGYRAPATNSMLRARSGGVAQHSQHMLGKAIDLKVRNVSLDRQREAAMRLQRGGVGYYPGSQFIHVDVAGVRHWPRMTYDQLARVFPNGRTVHVPSNGKPLPGYQLALADLQKHGSAPSLASLEAARAAGVDTAAPARPGRNLLAALFGGGKDPEEDEDATRATAALPAASPKPADGPRATRLQTARVETAKPETAKVEPAKLDTAKQEPAKQEPAKPGAIRAAAVKPPAPPAAPEPEMFALASASSTPVTLTPTAASTSVAILGEEPPRPRAEMGSASEPAAASEQPYRTASAGGDVIIPTRERTVSQTGSLWPRNRDAADRVPLELALAYAAEPDRRGNPASPARAPAMGSLVDRARLTAETPAAAPAPTPTADGTPLAMVKKTAARLPGGRGAETVAATVPAPTAAVVPVVPGMRFDDPWLRAVMMAPNLHTSLTVTSYGDPDFSELSGLMGKPIGSVVMSFANEPYPGLGTERFSGGAVVFLATVTFRRTASLH
ncbi:MAG: DUF882 domain-containing protein [Rhodoplanes sp.]|uniref:DUF882 domain-containing protein n=1 Tax=Rhodoplanes sp. TaxID=1968906 RepID=UPI0018200216|nr:DUF882 domain-containing protein [Rhodoplanes sp.]NVO15200.1 DUF882 domain-containing protein [Rhodoplanes sp.]